MELKQIKELMMSMARTGTRRLVIKKEGIELELEQQDRFQPSTSVFSESPEEFSWRADESIRRSGAGVQHLPPSQAVPGQKQEPSKADTTSLYITSPMVGTCYSSPSPEDAPFIKIGDVVDKNTVVCIIEAMKVMNEIKAGVSGTVVETLIQSGHPVEFGTKLFRIQPTS